MMTSYEMTSMSEPYDHNDAILEIHQDLVVLRLRTGVICCFVYTRYGNAKGFKGRVLDYQAGRAGIKSSNHII